MGTASRPTTVEVEDLWRSFGAVQAVRGISFRIGDGELVSILGPSGCGKTTTLRLIAGLERADGGCVRLAGDDVTGRAPYERDVGVVFQNYALFPHMSVYDNVAYGLRARRATESGIKDRVAEMLRLARLDSHAHRYPRELSGGQQQRVALARALAPRPRLLLLDEPLSNLDAKLRLQMREEILRIQREIGVTTIFVTHDQEEALSLSDRLIVMNGGVIEQVGTPVELYESPATPFVADFVGHAAAFEGAVTGAAAERMTVRSDGFVLSVRRDAAVAPGAQVLVIVKQERVRFLEPGQSADNVLEGTCLARSYLGATVRYQCAIADRTLWALVPAQSETRRRSPGEQVRIGWDAADTSVLRLSEKAARDAG